jgi:lambda family phage minor tail protein L
MSIALQSVKLQQSAPVELFVLDLAPLGGDVFRFAPQTNEKGVGITWQSQLYAPFPIECSGFEARASGPLPRPRLRCSNVLGTLGPLMRSYDNLRGAHLVRKRTMAMYLDGVNFEGGNPTADPLADYDDETWIVDQCSARNRLQVEWELRSPLDFMGVMLPARVVHPNFCPWRYRSSDCGYAGPPVATVEDAPTSDPAQDRCSKRLSGCKLRYPNQPLPAGFFPAVGQLRQL